MGTPMATTVVLLPVWTTRIFGRKYYGSIYGAVSIVSNLFAAFGYLMFTGIHDWWGGYGASLVFGVVSCAAALALIGAVRKSETYK